MRFLSALAWVTLLGACTTTGTNDAGTNNTADAAAVARPACDELGEACHHSTTTLGMECHEYGHDTSHTNAQCEARHPECLAECAETDGGHVHNGDGGADMDGSSVMHDH